MTDSLLTYWKTANVDYIAFDVREDNPVSEIAAPCFYVSPDNAVKWSDSLKVQRNLLVICHNGILAQNTANRIAAKGYPADKLWYAGFNQLVSHRRSASDTLLTSLLMLSTPRPSPINAYALRSIMLSKRDVKVLDVRTASEIAGGMVPGACNLDWYSTFTANAQTCIGNSKEVLLYCASGNRAGQARTWIINNLGLDSAKVVNMGGYSSLWASKGLPVAFSPSQDCLCLSTEKTVQITKSGTLLKVLPNPFNSSVRLNYYGKVLGGADLKIFTIRGELLFEKKLVSGFPVNGIVWRPNAITSGIYLARLNTGSGILKTVLTYKQ
ncbi:MAG: T9SS type A sorting domain-containing protein [Fibrobacteres bacterium]|nr:T9SS type A sorting domain-containing protein [Fibrobacterota bacterium]